MSSDTLHVCSRREAAQFYDKQQYHHIPTGQCTLLSVKEVSQVVLGQLGGVELARKQSRPKSNLEFVAAIED